MPNDAVIGLTADACLSGERAASLICDIWKRNLLSVCKIYVARGVNNEIFSADSGLWKV
jgi:hypothetical protein